jgi:hypothetical protein
MRYKVKATYKHEDSIIFRLTADTLKEAYGQARAKALEVFNTNLESTITVVVSEERK